MRHAALVLALVAAVLAAGCAGDPEPATPTAAPTTDAPTTDAPTTDAPTTDAPTSPPAPPSPTASPGPSASPFPANTQPDTEQGSGAPVTLVDVRVGQHEGYERVALDLAGGDAAGWDARYVDDPRHQGSGEPVDVDGDAVLQVDLTNIGLPDDTGVAMYDGPSRLAVGDTIVEVVVGTTFEGHTQVFVGVTGERPFRVLRVGDSVVVDVVA